MSERDETDLNNRRKRLSEEDIEILKKVIERERALSWLSNSTKWIAAWVIAVFGAWALFSKWITEQILRLTGNG